MSLFYPLTIKDKIQETKDAVSLVFEVPDSIAEHYTFKAGQYLTLEAMIDGSRYKRAYSLSVGEQSSQLRVTIKAITDGVFSNYACKELKKGNVLKVSEATGRFTLPNSDTPKNYFAFGAGSGITPLFSMLETTLSSCEQSTFSLVYGNKTPEDTIFKKQIDALCSKYPNRLKVFYVFSQKKVEGCFQGRIGVEVVSEVLEQVKDIDYLMLCGPEAMIIQLSTFFKEKGFGDDQIGYELFYKDSTNENPLEEERTLDEPEPKEVMG